MRVTSSRKLSSPRDQSKSYQAYRDNAAISTLFIKTRGWLLATTDAGHAHAQEADIRYPISSGAAKAGPKLFDSPRSAENNTKKIRNVDGKLCIRGCACAREHGMEIHEVGTQQ
jgi:hypothetical protein